MRVLNNYKIIFLALLVLVVLVSCAREGLDRPFDPNFANNSSQNATTWLNPDQKERLLNGEATGTDIHTLISMYRAKSPLNVGETPSSTSISMPETGQLSVTLRENDAGWQSKIYLKANNEIFLLFNDSRLGPLNTTSSLAYQSGTLVDIFLVTYAGNGEVFTNLSDSVQCKVEYFANEKKWIFKFEDKPADGHLGTPDWDYNDAVVEVQMASDSFLDLSAYLDISIDYLDHHGFNADGYAIYYIGETLNYKVNINKIKNHELLGSQKYSVYVVHEYFESTTCNRTWYPSPPRPQNESAIITVNKGDLLPNQAQPAMWNGITFNQGAVTLTGNYTSTLEIASGNDQTHVIIVQEDPQGNIGLTIYDNPTAGVFDPPPSN